jgi:TatD DNase family protein
LVDSHCHLQNEAFDADREAVIAHAQAAGIRRILVPGYDLPSSEAAIELARRHPELIDAAVGVHPHYAASMDSAAWAQLEALATQPGVKAIGEIGLDFFRDLSPRSVQLEALHGQLDLAVRLGMPVIVHDRDAHAEVTSALLGWPGPNREAKGVLHCFSGDAEMAMRLSAAGFLVSFALPVTFSSARGPRAAAAALANDAFLVETDSPWLAPGGGGARNEPTTALRVAAELARLRGTSAEAVAASVARAYARLVGGQVA